MTNIEVIPTHSDIIEKLKSLHVLSETSSIWEDIIYLVEKCMVPSLKKPYDEYNVSINSELASSFDEINNNLSIFIEILGIFELKFTETRMNKEFVASLLLLLEEMKENSSLFENSYMSNLKFASDWFQKTYDFHLLYNSYDSNVQKYRDEIFYICMQKLHSKLTRERWKYHPVSLHCYRMAINQWLKIQKIRCPLPLIFPVTLMQIDDFNEVNKAEGLKCCCSILKYLDHDYTNTGYEVVIYETVLKYISYRDIDILSEALQCIAMLLPIFYTKAPRSTWTKSDDVFEIILEDLFNECDLKKKGVYFKNLPALIGASGNSVIRWKNKIMHLILENLEACLNSMTARQILLLDCLESLKVWFQLSWPVWNYSTDSKTVSNMYKIIYVLSKEPNENSDKYIAATEECLLIMLSRCTEEQRLQLLDDEGLRVSLLGPKFQEIWNKIKVKINNKKLEQL